MSQHLKIESGAHPKGLIDLGQIIRSVKSSHSFLDAGAIATFTGVVRRKTVRSDTVQKLVIEAYEEKANTEIQKICKGLKRRKGIIDVQIHHLIGEFKVGEDIVYVVVAGEHRKEVFATLGEAVERYKKQVPIFKKEYVMDKRDKKKSYWVSERGVTDA